MTNEEMLARIREIERRYPSLPKLTQLPKDPAFARAVMLEFIRELTEMVNAKTPATGRLGFVRVGSA